jgi:hypothetical protein
MIILNKDLWESDRILKLRSSENWEGNDVSIMLDCTLAELKSILQECESSKRAIIIIDCNKGMVPPLYQISKIALFFVQMKPILIKYLDFTIIYSKKDDYKIWLDTVLKLYVPARPIHIARSKDDVKSLISQRGTITDVDSEDEIAQVGV